MKLRDGTMASIMSCLITSGSYMHSLDFITKSILQYISQNQTTPSNTSQASSKRLFLIERLCIQFHIRHIISRLKLTCPAQLQIKVQIVIHSNEILRKNLSVTEFIYCEHLIGVFVWLWSEQLLIDDQHFFIFTLAVYLDPQGPPNTIMCDS